MAAFFARSEEEGKGAMWKVERKGRQKLLDVECDAPAEREKADKIEDDGMEWNGMD